MDNRRPISADSTRIPLRPLWAESEIGAAQPATGTDIPVKETYPAAIAHTQNGTYAVRRNTGPPFIAASEGDHQVTV